VAVNHESTRKVSPCDLAREFEHVASCKADKAFVKLMLVQWVEIALILSPRQPDKQANV
jgi:hypothetical protein